MASQSPDAGGSGVGGDTCSASDLYTWLGALACGVNLTGEEPDDYVSTFRTPEPHSVCRYGIRTRWSGMVHSDWICDLLGRARLCVQGLIQRDTHGISQCCQLFLLQNPKHLVKNHNIFVNVLNSMGTILNENPNTINLHNYNN